MRNFVFVASTIRRHKGIQVAITRSRDFSFSLRHLRPYCVFLGKTFCPQCRAKFAVSRFNRSEDIKGFQNFKSGHVTHYTKPAKFIYILSILLLVIYLYSKLKFLASTVPEI